MRSAMVIVTALCVAAPWCFATSEARLERPDPSLAIPVGHDEPAVRGRSIPIPTLEGGREIRGGDRVVIRWSPFESEELELLLSTDGGRTYPLRVSPELEGRSSQYVWRVPNLPACDARVRIRARIDDRETDGPPSAAFAITRDPGRPAERWLFREAGGWGEHERESPQRFRLDAPKRRRTLGAGESVPSPDAPTRIGLPVPTPRFQARVPSGPLPAGATSTAHDTLVPRFRPMRE